MPDKKDYKAKPFSIKWDILVCLLLFIATLLAYWQVTGHEFVRYDDDVYITENSHVKAGLTPESIRWSLTATDSGNWHPLTWLSHMLDVQLFGMNAGRHHLTNLLLHIANSLLLFLVLKRMTGASWQSFLVAALFALHPLNVESVTWVSERKNVLSTFFWILTMGSYALYVERPNAVRYIPVFLLLMLGLAAKPMLVTLPFALLLLDYWPLGRLKIGPPFPFIDKQQRSIAFHLLLEKAPLFALIAASSFVTFLVEQSAGSVVPLGRHPLNARIANAVVSYVVYIEKMFWPSHLAVLYPHPGKLPMWQVAGACLLLLIISLLAIRVVIRHPYFAVGWLWYIGTLVPVIGLVQVGYQALADRYAYVPLIGLFMIIAWGFYEIVKKWHRRQLVLIVTAIALCSVLMTATWVQVRYWANSITLFEHALEHTDNSSVMHCSLGVALADQERRTEAIRHYSEALRIDPNYVKAHNNMGIALKNEGRTDEAIYHYSEALRINPYSAEAHYNLGNALADKGRLDEAIDHFSRALQIDPDDAEAHNNLGNALCHQGRLDEAVDHFSRLLQIEPDNAEAHNNLGNALTHLGRLDEAIHHYFKSLHINPGYAEVHNNLGIALAKAGRTAEAIDHYIKALHSNPNYAEAHINLGVELDNQGRIDEAIDHFQKALSLKPEFIEAMYHLAKLYISRAEYEKALSLYQKMLTFVPDNPAVYYNIACIYARQNKPEESIPWLKKAVENGFNDWNHIKTDVDLDNIRGSSDFQEFLKSH